MKSITCWRDLQPFGIDLLTGEACGLMYRFLCDLTDQGKHVIEKCLGCRIIPAKRWNRGTDEQPHIGSIMLSPDMLVPLSIFALLESGCQWRIQCDKYRCYGGTEVDPEASSSNPFFKPSRTRDNFPPLA